MAQAILTVQRVGSGAFSVEQLILEVQRSLRFVPLCIMCSLRKEPGVVAVHGVCVKCGSDADSYGPKKIIKRRLTVR